MFFAAARVKIFFITRISGNKCFFFFWPNNVSSESRFSSKHISEADIQKGISDLNSKKAEKFGKVPTKGKEYTEKLADILQYLKKKHPALLENYRPSSVLLCVCTTFERIIQKQFSSFVVEILSLDLCGYSKAFNTQYALLFHIQN